MLDDSLSAKTVMDERDIKKPGLHERELQASRNRLAGAMAELCVGTADAVAQAFRSFGDELSGENLTKIGISNGFIAGVVAGNASFFEQLAKTSQRVYAELKQPEEAPRPRNVETLDYELLARMVAAEMLKAQAAPESRPVEPVIAVVETPSQHSDE